MSLVKFVGMLEKFPPGHLIVGRPFDMDGCLTAPWWAAPFVRAQRSLWHFLMKKCSRVNRWELELKRAELAGRRRGYEQGIRAGRLMAAGDDLVRRILDLRDSQ